MCFRTYPDNFFQNRLTAGIFFFERQIFPFKKYANFQYVYEWSRKKKKTVEVILLKDVRVRQPIAIINISITGYPDRNQHITFSLLIVP